MSIRSTILARLLSKLLKRLRKRGGRRSDGKHVSRRRQRRPRRLPLQTTFLKRRSNPQAKVAEDSVWKQQRKVGVEKRKKGEINAAALLYLRLDQMSRVAAKQKTMEEQRSHQRSRRPAKATRMLLPSRPRLSKDRNQRNVLKKERRRRSKAKEKGETVAAKTKTTTQTIWTGFSATSVTSGDAFLLIFLLMIFLIPGTAP
mmetsp:Transcript_29061/g.42758  ORF Transcript_29061/g.42758 Transcript_29061/m.42758 type:complete len:201 (+) Transcript_29061:2433-3035(+)